MKITENSILQILLILCLNKIQIGKTRMGFLCKHQNYIVCGTIDPKAQFAKTKNMERK